MSKAYGSPNFAGLSWTELLRTCANKTRNFARLMGGGTYVYDANCCKEAEKRQRTVTVKTSFRREKYRVGDSRTRRVLEVPKFRDPDSPLGLKKRASP